MVFGKEKQERIGLMRKVIMFGCCVALIAVAGCGKKAGEKISEKVMEKAMEKAIKDGGGGEASVDIQGETMKVQTKEGNITISGGSKAKIPANFPKDIYVYEGAEVAAVIDAGEALTLSLTCKDTPAKVASTYKEKMKEKGWGIEQSMDMGGQQIVMLKKAERQVVVTVGDNQGSTFIGLVLEK